MLDPRREPRSFGADDTLVCPNCNERMSLTRRGPVDAKDLEHERQIFTCAACDHQIERIVDAIGNPTNSAPPTLPVG